MKMWEMKSALPLPVLYTSCCNISVLFQTFFGHNDDSILMMIQFLNTKKSVDTLNLSFTHNFIECCLLIIGEISACLWSWWWSSRCSCWPTCPGQCSASTRSPRSPASSSAMTGPVSTACPRWGQCPGIKCRALNRKFQFQIGAKQL